jgi:hypothetical protein
VHNRGVVRWRDGRAWASRENWGGEWTEWANARRIHSNLGELMADIAAQREDRARRYRQMAARSSGQAQRSHFLSRAEELDRLAARAREFSAAEYGVAGASRRVAVRTDKPHGSLVRRAKVGV